MNIPEQSTFRGNSCFVVRTIPELINIPLVAPSVPFWARGESKEYDTPCLPTLYRTDHSFTDRVAYFESGSLSKGEFEAIESCKMDYIEGHLLDELFNRFMEGHNGEINLRTNDLLYWASLAQHYNEGQIYPTRLLDVTSDILVAAYFACVSHYDSDGYVFFGNFAHSDLLIGGDVKTKDSFFDILEIKDTDYPRDSWKPSDETLFLAALPYPNRRMTAQRGALVWARKPSEGYFNQMKQVTVKIPSEHKEEMLKHLSWLGYSHETLFPVDLPSQSSIVRH